MHRCLVLPEILDVIFALAGPALPPFVPPPLTLPRNRALATLAVLARTCRTSALDLLWHTLVGLDAVFALLVYMFVI